MKIKNNVVKSIYYWRINSKEPDNIFIQVEYISSKGDSFGIVNNGNLQELKMLEEKHKIKAQEMKED